MTTQKWKLLELIVSIKNKWLTVFGERLADENNQPITYWRVERPDSIIVIPFHNDNILLPKPYYRRGIDQFTYDFPGGRYNPEISHEEAAYGIIERELGVVKKDIIELLPINKIGWAVDSSFSTQNLYVFEAHIQKNTTLDSDNVDNSIPVTRSGFCTLLDQLSCLQCRCALLQWMNNQHYSQIKD